jgi:hypothetical protein
LPVNLIYNYDTLGIWLVFPLFLFSRCYLITVIPFSARSSPYCLIIFYPPPIWRSFSTQHYLPMLHSVSRLVSFSSSMPVIERSFPIHRQLALSWFKKYICINVKTYIKDTQAAYTDSLWRCIWSFDMNCATVWHTGLWMALVSGIFYYNIV